MYFMCKIFSKLLRNEFTFIYIILERVIFRLWERLETQFFGSSFCQTFRPWGSQISSTQLEEILILLFIYIIVNYTRAHAVTIDKWLNVLSVICTSLCNCIKGLHHFNHTYGFMYMLDLQAKRDMQESQSAHDVE